MSSDATEMPGSEPGKATCAKNAQVQPASAAMPNEEDVARALCIADGKDPDFDYDPLGLGRPAGTDLRWRCYLSQARAVLALFAPVQAEKERVERNREMWKGQCERQAETLRELRRQMLADKGQNHER